MTKEKETELKQAFESLPIAEQLAKIHTGIVKLNKKVKKLKHAVRASKGK